MKVHCASVHRYIACMTAADVLSVALFGLLKGWMHDAWVHIRGFHHGGWSMEKQLNGAAA